MSNKLQPVRGTKDLYGKELELFQLVVEIAQKAANAYCYEGIQTPILEFTEVFARSVGETSDIVSKEMYSFLDRGGESLSLRPEFTAAVIRSFISNGMQQNLPLKLFSYGPLFRYERPQLGRQRQFHQINVEYLGAESYLADAEVIDLGRSILTNLGIIEKTTLEINSLGSKEDRAKHRDSLVAYLSKYKNDLSEDSKLRLEKNPLRILDSKDENDKKIIIDAPVLAEFYSNESRSFFDNLLSSLDDLAIAYQINPKLVRGLDYYSNTVFEFTTSHLGAQSTVLGGGRYNGLISMMGGSDVPGIGFGAGIERMMLLTQKEQNKPRPIAIIPIGDELVREGFMLARHLRDAGFRVVFDSDKDNSPLKRRMKNANKNNAKIAVLFGEDEAQKGVFKVKNMDLGQEIEVTAENLIDTISGMNL